MVLSFQQQELFIFGGKIKMFASATIDHFKSDQFFLGDLDWRLFCFELFVNFIWIAYAKDDDYKVPAKDPISYKHWRILWFDQN